MALTTIKVTDGTLAAISEARATLGKEIGGDVRVLALVPAMLRVAMAHRAELVEAVKDEFRKLNKE